MSEKVVDGMQQYLDALIDATDEKMAQVAIYVSFFKEPVMGAIRYPKVGETAIEHAGIYEFLAVEGPEKVRLLVLRSGHITIAEPMKEQPRIVTPGNSGLFTGTPQ